LWFSFWVTLMVTLFRARKDTVLPLSKPIVGRDGTEVGEILVPQSTNVFIAIRGVNRSVDIWGLDADEWKPERWLSPLPDSVTKARIPGIYSNLSVLVFSSFVVLT
jgi:cytochrome P450